MKVVYDYQSFCVAKYNGVSNYFASIVPYLINMGVDCKFPFTYTDSCDLHSLNIKRFLSSPSFLDDRIGRRIQLYTSKKETQWYLSHKEYDLVHSTQYNPYLFAYTDRPVVVTIHDMIQELFNLFKEDIENKKESINKASKIIAISNNTKKDLLHFFPDIPESKIEVIYHGYQERKQLGKPNQYGRYILYVGQRDGYKNFERFFSAIAPLLKKDSNLNLVCTGRGFSQNENYLIEKENLRLQCHSNFFNIDDMPDLYHNAIVFVYPSLYEGFGLPILDAFHNDCPVCLSNTSCFPEIADVAGVYFDPQSEDSIREEINKVVYNQVLRTQMIELGRERKNYFSWEISAEKHLKLYKSLI